jgi:hypothetical protein
VTCNPSVMFHLIHVPKVLNVSSSSSGIGVMWMTHNLATLFSLFGHYHNCYHVSYFDAIVTAFQLFFRSHACMHRGKCDH